MERRLAAILAADVVGYSRLMAADEKGTHARLKALRQDFIEPKIAEHHGRIVKLMGDGALVEFASVVDAVEGAAAIQAGVAERQAELPEDRRIAFRIGINIGDIIIEDGDIYGGGVNIAARLEGLADGGGICVARNVYDQVKDKVPFGFEPMGEHAVKNIPEPVAVYRLLTERSPAVGKLVARRSMRWPLVAAAAVLVMLAGIALWQRPWESGGEPGAQAGKTIPHTAKPSIAVLPFDDFHGDDATARLARGVTEDIITDLARFPEFDVIARNSTAVYEDKAVDAREVGEALGVGYVLEGSIQRDGERLRITAQLIDAATGGHLWSERWDRTAEDIFAVQTEIAETVANRLGGGAGLVQQAGRMAAHRKPPSNLTAYELYLLGTEKLEQVNRADVDEAIRLLNRAVEIDPGLARAWVELYHAHATLAGFGVEAETNQRLADDAALSAVRLDPGDAEAHAVLGMSLGMKDDLVRAKAEFDTALSLAPGAAEILTFYAGWSSGFGEPERGAEMVDRVIRLNPNYPTWSAGPFSYAYFQAGRYEDALRMSDRLIPDNYWRLHWAMRAGALAAVGRTEEAKTLVQKALERHPDLTIEAIANEPGYSDAERQRLTDGMRLAGFPSCTRAEERAGLTPEVRLAECEDTR